MEVHPLVFEPIFKPKIWGGRRLETVLNKRLPPGERIGEAWEIADLENDQSLVAYGSAKGTPLGRLVREWGCDLLGEAPLFDGRFPLLIKFLDAAETLSVQVHPDRAMAERLGGRVRIKNEAWYVLATEPGGVIYRGVQPGVDAQALRRAIDDGSVESVLNRIEVRPGRCYYLPSGTIHALGAGVMVAEVQTPSDITYRVFDWNRIDASTGRPRELHVEQALACTSFDAVPVEAERPHHVAGVWTAVSTLVRCDSFFIRRLRMPEGVEQDIPLDGFAVWMVLEGRAAITCRGSADPVTVGIGDTVLIPASIENPRIKILENCMWLEAGVPTPSSLASFERPKSEAIRHGRKLGDDYVRLNVPDERTPSE